MLKIIIPASSYQELWDEENEEFISVPSIEEQTLLLEHSLVSLSLWESKWCKPFFREEEMTFEETTDYIRCMSLDQDVDPEVFLRITQKDFARIKEYLAAPMTATTVNDPHNKRGRKEKITSELIYYWMIALNIPFECERWHINRLLMLIRVCNAMNAPKDKKRSQRAIAADYAAINRARRQQYNSKG